MASKTIDFKISTNSINKALSDYYQMIEGMTSDALASLTKEMVDEARRNIEQVKLDGPPVDIEVDFDQLGPRSFEVSASGTQALFAEYGTGVYYGDNYPGVNPYGAGSYGPKGLQPYWFYTLPSGNQFGAGGDFAKEQSKSVINYYDAKGNLIESKNGVSPRMRIYNQWVKKGLGNKGITLKDFESRFARTESSPSDKKKTDVGITHGNRPYAYMYNAFQTVLQKAPALAKKHYDWSHIYD